MQMTIHDAIGHFSLGRLEELDFLPQIQDLYDEFTTHKEEINTHFPDDELRPYQLMVHYKSKLEIMLREGGDLQTVKKKEPISKAQSNAFKDFRQGNLSQLEFIPNVQELRDDFVNAMKGTCCKSRSKVVTTHRELFLKAFDANQ